MHAWGWDEAGAPASPARFAVELDQRFLTELAHTAVLFTELFDQGSRPHLLRVRSACSEAFSFPGHRLHPGRHVLATSSCAWPYGGCCQRHTMSKGPVPLTRSLRASQDLQPHLEVVLAAVQAMREKFGEYVALMKRTLLRAAEAAAAHMAGIRLLSQNEPAPSPHWGAHALRAWTV